MEEYFRKNGFIKAPVLSPEEVQELRALILKTYAAFHGEGTGGIKYRFLNAPDVLSQEAIALAALNKKIIKLLKNILEDSYTLFPDFNVQINMFGSLIENTSGWHIDCGSEVPNSYLFEKDYRFVKCGLYLQDNVVEYGGAVDMMPGFHKFFIRTGNNWLDFKIKSLLIRLFSGLLGKRMDIKSGDFVAFDSRLPHRSTPPSQEIVDALSDEERKSGSLCFSRFPKNHTKIVIYFNACRSKYTDSHLENDCIRAFNEIENKGKKGGENPFTHYLQLRYPSDFPEAFEKLVDENLLKIATIRDETFREKCKEHVLNMKKFMYKENKEGLMQ